jgi:hypothetical protein
MAAFMIKGWPALRDFYDLSLGGWVTIVFLRQGRFKIRVKDRFGKNVRIHQLLTLL